MLTIIKARQNRLAICWLSRMQEKRACAGRVERGTLGAAAWLTAFGHRPQQQDVALAQPNLYGIFDGHGPDGLLTAQRAAQLLSEALAAHPTLASHERVNRAFQVTQTRLIEVRGGFLMHASQQKKKMLLVRGAGERGEWNHGHDGDLVTKQQQ